MGNVDCCSSIFSSGSHHLNNGVCLWWLRVSITSFRTPFALLLQYFESAVPTDRRAYSLDIDCFGALKGGEQHITITERIHSPCCACPRLECVLTSKHVL